MRKRTDYRLQGRLILVILFAALAAGCAVAPLTVFEQPKNYDGPYGYIVGSMVKDRRGEDPSPNGGSGYINFSSDDDTWVFNYAIMVDAPPIASKWDFVEDDYRGFVFLIPVAPGNYEIDKTGGYFPFTTYWTKEPFSLPFTVEEGRSTYIGEYTFRHELGGEFVGPYFSVSSNTERDYPMLEGKYPEFDAAKTREWYPDENVLFHIIRESDMKELREVTK